MALVNQPHSLQKSWQRRCSSSLQILYPHCRAPSFLLCVRIGASAGRPGLAVFWTSLSHSPALGARCPSLSLQPAEALNSPNLANFFRCGGAPASSPGHGAHSARPAWALPKDSRRKWGSGTRGPGTAPLLAPTQDGSDPVQSACSCDRGPCAPGHATPAPYTRSVPMPELICATISSPAGHRKYAFPACKSVGARLPPEGTCAPLHPRTGLQSGWLEVVARPRSVAHAADLRVAPGCLCLCFPL